MASNELSHHGILGMKWGVRRYQNEDGSLKPAGKKRYADGYDEKERKADKKYYADRGSVKRINSRMKKGMTLEDARNEEEKTVEKKRRHLYTLGAAALVGSVASMIYGERVAGNGDMRNLGRAVVAGLVSSAVSMYSVSKANKMDTNEYWYNGNTGDFVIKKRERQY